MKRATALLPFAGVALITCGAAVAFLAAFGHRIQYTHTYEHLARIVPTTFDIDGVVLLFAVAVNMCFISLWPTAKSGQIPIFKTRRRVLVVVGVAGLIGGGGTIVLLATGLVYRFPPLVWVFDNSLALLFILLTGALGFNAFYFAVRSSHNVGSDLKSIGARIAPLIPAVICALMALFLMELRFATPDRLILATQPGVVQKKATHSISLILKDYPEKLRIGSSQVFEFRFRLTPYDSSETPPRYPITLAPNHQYTVAARARATNLVLVDPPKESMQPRPLVVGELYAWDWIVAPKKGTEGENQALALDVLLIDKSDGTLVFGSPVTTLILEVTTPLGLPGWLISPQVAVASIVGGLVSIVLPWLLGEWSQRRKERKPQPSIWVPPQSDD